jgi:hypothetical protein
VSNALAARDPARPPNIPQNTRTESASAVPRKLACQARERTLLGTSTAAITRRPAETTTPTHLLAAPKELKLFLPGLFDLAQAALQHENELPPRRARKFYDVLGRRENFKSLYPGIEIEVVEVRPLVDPDPIAGLGQGSDSLGERPHLQPIDRAVNQQDLCQGPVGPLSDLPNSTNSPHISLPKYHLIATDTVALSSSAVLWNQPNTSASKRIAMRFLGSSPAPLRSSLETRPL